MLVNFGMIVGGEIVQLGEETNFPWAVGSSEDWCPSWRVHCHPLLVEGYFVVESGELRDGKEALLEWAYLSFGRRWW